VLSTLVPISAGSGTFRSLSDGGGLSFSASFSKRVTPSSFGNLEFHLALYRLEFVNSTQTHLSIFLTSNMDCYKINGNSTIC